jgi:hypothetical protein
MMPVLLSLLLFTLGAPAGAEACSCLRVSTCQSVVGTDAIFEGTVESVESLGNGADASSDRAVRFRDVRAWKGEGQAIVVTGANTASCGYDFEPGRRYVVGADRSDDGSLSTGFCSLTRPIEDAGELLAHLASLNRPSAGAWIGGAVTTAGSPLESYQPNTVAGARVSVTGPTQQSVVSDAAGAYRISGLLPGDYQITAAPPASRPELTWGGRGRQVTLARGVDCAVVDLTFEHVGKLEGVVHDEEGSPLASAIVNVRLADRRGFASYLKREADANGYYVFESIAPGRYVVGVNLQGATPASPYEMAYASVDGGRPTPLVLEAGETLTVPPIVARRPSIVEVRGIVRNAVGTPLARMTVTASPTGEERIGRAILATATTDAGGRFLLQLHRGARYNLRARTTGLLGMTDIVAGEVDDVEIYANPVTDRRHPQEQHAVTQELPSKGSAP